MARPEVYLGLDFGTTNSVLALFKDGAPHVIDIFGRQTTPTAIAFNDKSETVIGTAALTTGQSVRAFKRVLGLSAAQGRELVDSFKGSLPFVTEEEDNLVAIRCKVGESGNASFELLLPSIPG